MPWSAGILREILWLSDTSEKLLLNTFRTFKIFAIHFQSPPPNRIILYIPNLLFCLPKFSIWFWRICYCYKVSSFLNICFADFVNQQYTHCHLSKNSSSRLVTLIHKSIIAEQIKNSFTLHFKSPNKKEYLEIHDQIFCLRKVPFDCEESFILKSSQVFKKFLKKELFFHPSWVLVPSTVPHNSQKSLRSCFPYGSRSCLTRLLALFSGWAVQLFFLFCCPDRFLRCLVCGGFT